MFRELIRETETHKFPYNIIYVIDTLSDYNRKPLLINTRQWERAVNEILIILKTCFLNIESSTSSLLVSHSEKLHHVERNIKSCLRREKWQISGHGINATLQLSLLIVY